MSEKARTTEDLQAQVLRLKAASLARQRMQPRPAPDWSGSNPGNLYPRPARGRYGSHRE